MPIYEYKCLGCNSHFEKMQKVSDEPLKTCEKCGGKLEKQISLSGFQFKGAGWYVTDYSNKTKETGSEKPIKATTPEKTENTEKTSAPESTAKSESASKETSDTSQSSKKEAVSKKD